MKFLNKILGFAAARAILGFAIVFLLWLLIASTPWSLQKPQSLWLAHPYVVLGHLSEVFFGAGSEASPEEVALVEEARKSVIGSVKRIICSFALVFLIGLPIGLLFGQASTAFRIAHGPLELWRAIPPIATLPICFFIFDQVGESSLFGLVSPDDKARILSVLFGCVPILVIQVADTVRSIPEERRAFAEQAQATFYFRLRWLLIYELLPTIFVSLRTVLSFSVIIIVAGEMAWAPQYGIGARLMSARFAEDPLPASYAFAIIAGAIAYFGSVILHWSERKIVTWK